jgi:hypothetical protein
MRVRMATGVLAALATAAAMSANTALAGDVSWSVTIGSPRPAPRVIYAPPPVVYSPPPVVYAPPPVVYAPAPVVYHPAPVYQAAPVYYVPPGHLKKWHKHQHRYGAYSGVAYPGAVMFVKGRGHGRGYDD